MTALELLPAVDVASGQAVRLVQGEAGSATDYGDPLDAALAWQAAGAQWIHLVDLDAAFGRGSNRDLLASVIGRLDVAVELSGGIRDDESLTTALATGCKRVNVGTAALEIIRDWRWILLEVELDQLQCPRLALGGDRVTGLDQQTGNGSHATVKLNVSMGDHLPRGGTRLRPTEPVDDVVQAALHDAQEHLAGVFRRARGQLEVAAELALEDAVEAFELLFFTQAHPVFAQLAAAEAVHARRLIALVDGALGAVTATALEIQLDPFAAAQSANRIDMASHGSQSINAAR